MNHFDATAAELVRLLPSPLTGMIAQRKRFSRRWTTGSDYRVICTCQRHAQKERSGWHRAVRFAARGAVVMIGVPVALVFGDFPTNAMNINVDALRASAVRAMATSGFNAASVTIAASPRQLQVFSPAVRDRFLEAKPLQRAFTLDGFKEEYFRTHVPYGEIIYREATKNDLPPELVAAMVHTESDFRPQLVSRKSAQGLMQIVPETARLLNIENPFDPEQNIAAGTRYLRYLLDRFEDERIALAAYNAGEGNVERFGGVPPFPETLSYVDKVHQRAARYRERVRVTYMAASRMRRLVN